MTRSEVKEYFKHIKQEYNASRICPDQEIFYTVEQKTFTLYIPTGWYFQDEKDAIRYCKNETKYPARVVRNRWVKEENTLYANELVFEKA